MKAIHAGGEFCNPYPSLIIDSLARLSLREKKKLCTQANPTAVPCNCGREPRIRILPVCARHGWELPTRMATTPRVCGSHAATPEHPVQPCRHPRRYPCQGRIEPKHDGGAGDMVRNSVHHDRKETGSRRDPCCRSPHFFGISPKQILSHRICTSTP